MKIRYTLLTLLSILLTISSAQLFAQNVKTISTPSLSLTYYNSPEASFGVTSVLVAGKKDAILIDAQFTIPNAENLAAEIKKSGKHLKAIFISYGDPDYYFGLEVFKKLYPQVPVYATAPIIAHIKDTYQGKLAYWGGVYKDAAPKEVIIPALFNGELELEGKKLEIVNVPGAPARSFIWIPSIKAVVGGINVFGNDFHLWTADDATTAKRDLWITALDKITSLHPQIVIPGHFGPKAALNLTSVEFTKHYLQVYDQLLQSKPNSAALIGTMKARYSDLGFLTGLEIGAKVNTGEMQWK